MLWHRLSLSLLHSLANGNKKLWTAKLCEHVCVFESVCVCECWANSHQTGAETLHLHRPFPACRVIPAPALPPLPSHTYQPPAAVPLPESGSSSLDTMDKQQQLIHLTLYLSLALSLFFFFLLNFSLLLSSLHTGVSSLFISFPQVTCCWSGYLRGLCDHNLKARLHKISALVIFCLSALPGCYSTSLKKKTPVIFQRHVG